MYCHVLNWISTDVSEVCAASVIRAITLMMEAARTSETLVKIQLRTWQYIPEDSELFTSDAYSANDYRMIYVLTLGSVFGTFNVRKSTV
jgi:hypothetical protein